MPDNSSNEDEIRLLKIEIANLKTRNQQLTQHTKDFIWISDDEFNFTYVSPSVEKVLGLKPEEIIGKHVSFLTAENMQEANEERIAALRKTLPILTSDQRRKVEIPAQSVPLKTHDGRKIWFEVNTSFLLDADANFLGLTGINRDITERMLIQDALRWNEAMFHEVFETSPEAIAIIDMETKQYTMINAGFTEETGWPSEEVVGKTADELELWVRPKDLEHLRGELERTERVKNFESEIRRKNGSVSTALISLAYFEIEGKRHAVSISRDISPLKHALQEATDLQLQLYRTQRLKALGTLAAGVAHDFNNILTGIQGISSLLEQDASDPKATLSHSKDIAELVESAADLTGQLLALGKDNKAKVDTLSSSDIIREHLNLFGRTEKGITILDNLGENLPPIEVDAHQFKQVLLNLLVNASHAMKEVGTLTISSKCVNLSDAIGLQQGIEPGTFIKMSFSDTGTGMDKETIQQIFDPFFTTKASGSGTGLGLATSFSIIQNHGGYIAVQSEIGRGSSFDIFLPISQQKARKVQKALNNIEIGSETILIIDDEEMVSKITAKMLAKIGYNVITINDGALARDTLLENPDCALVILDMIMPGMDGTETFDLVKSVAPDIFVLLASGYSSGDQTSEILRKGCNGFLQKPFRLPELSAKLREILQN